MPFVVRQTVIALSGLNEEQIGNTMLAYEPVWAIGEGSTPATAEQVGEMHGVLRQSLVDEYGTVGAGVPLPYGCSVNLETAPSLAAAPHVDALFVGRTAWDVDGFMALARMMASR